MTAKVECKRAFEVMRMNNGWSIRDETAPLV